MGKILTTTIDVNRIYGLDILRAAAIFFVVFGHGNMILGQLFPASLLSLLVFDGVSLFFVLSGFLIGSILIRTLDEHEFSWPVLLNFWMRRWFRILPNYYLILIVLTIFHLVFTNFNPFLTVKYALFIQNFSHPHPPFFGEAWSLSVEEWFYILIPLTLFGVVAIKGNHRQALLVVIIAYILFSTSVRWYRYLVLEIDSFEAWDTIFRKQVITRLDSLMIGVLGGYISFYHHKIWIAHRKWWFCMGVLFLLIHQLSFYFKDILTSNYNAYYCVYSFTLMSLGALFLLPYLSSLKQGKGSLYKFITFISIISYSMYLIHLGLVQHFLVPITLKVIPLGWDGAALVLVKYAIYWGYTLLGSVLLYKYFEAPLMLQREKYTKEILARNTVVQRQATS